MYRKGARAERELMEMLWSRGFAVVRSAGSGASYSPDIVAVRGNRVLAFECKFWKRTSLSVREEQMEKMKEWSRRAGVSIFIAWKQPYNGWLFFPMDVMKKARKNYVVTVEDAKKASVHLDVLLGFQDTL